MSIPTAVLSTLIQVSYTSIFGCIATILLLRTGSLFSPIASHMICNFIGLPNMGFLQPPGLDGNEYSILYKYRVVLCALHLLGLVVFSILLFPMTESLSSQSILWNQCYSYERR